MIVIGIGNEWRSDDAAGLEVARRLRPRLARDVRVAELEGEPADLLETWAGEDRVHLVDAVRSGRPPGTVHRLDGLAEPLPPALFVDSTHALGLPEALRLARELERLPRSLLLYGIEGESFEAGSGLSPPVEAAVERLVAELTAELASSRGAVG